jgi:cation diffusion facilitator family transporter
MAKPPRTPEPEHRRCQSCGTQFTWLNLIVNLALAILKGVIGVAAASRALMAGALYSINDVLSAIIAMISLRVARRPADQDHAYGHGKAEFIAVGIVSTILAVAVIFILFYSVADIIQGIDAPPHLIAILVAAVTMATNEFLARRGFCAAERLGSPVLRTTAEHNRADAISSLATIIGVGGAKLGIHLLDPLVAIFETIHIIWLSGSLLGNALRGLMDTALPPAMVSRVSSACNLVPGVEGVLRLRTRQAGPLPCVDVEVAVADHLTVLEAQAISHEVQRAVRSAMGRSTETQVKLRSTRAIPEQAVPSHG